MGKLRADFHQHQTSEQEPLLSRSLFLKEPLSGLVMR